MWSGGLSRLENFVLVRQLGWVGEAGFGLVCGQVVKDIAACLEGSPIRTPA